MKAMELVELIAVVILTLILAAAIILPASPGLKLAVAGIVLLFLAEIICKKDKSQ